MLIFPKKVIMMPKFNICLEVLRASDFFLFGLPSNTAINLQNFPLLKPLIVRTFQTSNLEKKTFPFSPIPTALRADIFHLDLKSVWGKMCAEKSDHFRGHQNSYCATSLKSSHFFFRCFSSKSKAQSPRDNFRFFMFGARENHWLTLKGCNWVFCEGCKRFRLITRAKRDRLFSGSAAAGLDCWVCWMFVFWSSFFC